MSDQSLKDASISRVNPFVRWRTYRQGVRERRAELARLQENLAPYDYLLQKDRKGNPVFALKPGVVSMSKEAADSTPLKIHLFQILSSDGELSGFIETRIIPPEERLILANEAIDSINLFKRGLEFFKYVFIALGPLSLLAPTTQLFDYIYAAVAVAATIKAHLVKNTHLMKLEVRAKTGFLASLELYIKAPAASEQEDPDQVAGRTLH
ncbi:hypothetical protein HY988_06630 [Candidatus Micrarchaeota archaeon]|nr:hypothetical protein [Candidatus Micrarchaeota archaeon]